MSPTPEDTMTEYKELAARLREEVRSDGDVLAGPSERELEAASAIEALEAERDEARRFAAHWHGSCQAIATVLGLPEPEEGFAGVVRDRVAAAEARCKRLEDALNAAMGMCDQYAGFIRHRVRAADIEVHPYLPELEQVIDVARLALQENTNGG